MCDEDFIVSQNLPTIWEATIDGTDCPVCDAKKGEKCFHNEVHAKRVLLFLNSEVDRVKRKRVE